MPEPLDLQEVRATWLQQCGPCDYGVTSAPCNCPPGDYRSVLLRAVDELDALRERVRVAELVCALSGITSPAGEGDRDKALTQAWQDWSHAYRSTHELVPAEVVADLARRRDEVRAATLARFLGADRAAAGGGDGNPTREDQPPPPEQTRGVDRG
jgi:hypothetical protein